MCCCLFVIPQVASVLIEPLCGSKPFFFFLLLFSLPPLFFLFKRMPFLSSTGSWLGPKTNRVVAESSQGQLGASQHSLSRFLTRNLLPVLSSSLAGSQ